VIVLWFVVAGNQAQKQIYLSCRDGPKDQTSYAQLRIGESRNSGFDAEPVIGPGGIAPD
jgi:hypothetical protein